MKTLLLSTVDTQPGAAGAAYQIHRGLCEAGADSRLLVQTRLGDDPTVIGARGKAGKARALVRPALDTVPLLLYPAREKRAFSTQWFPDSVLGDARAFRPDVVNVHFVTEGFVRVRTLARFGVPVVWTLHDMWPFTGGCHYAGTCEGYQSRCGRCPELHSRHGSDLSRWNMGRKARAWRDTPFTVVASSAWMADCARASVLFRKARIETIPLGFDTSRFRPADARAARDVLGLPQDKRIVLFGAQSATSDPRKGFGLLREALGHLAASLGERRGEIALVIFGASPPPEPSNLGFQTHYLERLHDDVAMVLAYSASDVMVVPSVQEAWGLTASEALSCGTPVVCWDATGPRDIVDHGVNGYRARPYDAEDLAHGIAWVLADPERRRELSRHGRRKAEAEWTRERQAQRYLSLFGELARGPAGDTRGAPAG